MESVSLPPLQGRPRAWQGGAGDLVVQARGGCGTRGETFAATAGSALQGQVRSRGPPPWTSCTRYSQALLGKGGFLTKERLSLYGSKRNDPTMPSAQSNLSPYLHSGQLAPQRAALEALPFKARRGARLGMLRLYTRRTTTTHACERCMAARSCELSVPRGIGFTEPPRVSFRQNSYKESVDSFLEELIIRRELSDNYVFYEPNYDNLEAAAGWAKETLEKHSADKARGCGARRSSQGRSAARDVPGAGCRSCCLLRGRPCCG